MNIEEIAFQLISLAGDGQGLLFKALKEAKKGNFDESDRLYELAQEKLKEAHKVQTNMLVQESNGEEVKINILMVHAQDHLMNCVIAKEFVKEFIELYKDK